MSDPDRAPYQQGPGPVVAETCARAIRAFLERRAEIGADRLKRGDQAEHHAGADRDERRMRAPANPPLPATHPGRRVAPGDIDRQRCADAGEAQHEAERSARHGKRQALRQHLADDATAARTESFLLTSASGLAVPTVQV